MTDKEDIANARIEFENGFIANITASRVSFSSERKMQIFQPDACISVDFQNRKLLTGRKEETTPVNPVISTDEKTFEAADAILDEIRDFLHAIESGVKPRVTGEDGRKALEIALMITNQFNKVRL
jgi:predicted dehydrogenase